MKKEKLSAKDLRFFPWPSPEAVTRVCQAANRLLKRRLVSKNDLIEAIRSMVSGPSGLQWESHKLQPVWHAVQLAVKNEAPKGFANEKSSERELLPQPLYYSLYGAENIEPKAIDQMDNAMRLPVTLAGALMPDAHEGYGLPIGGVLATLENVVIPYAVGVDIACRMCMSVFPLGADGFEPKRDILRSALGKHTIFGVGAKNSNHIDPSVFDLKEWNATKVIRQYRNLAYSQLGTSGAGNHFVEWGVLQVLRGDTFLRLQPGSYVALLSHSGSRGFGNEIASYYSRLAMLQNPLPQRARHLAWLNLDSEEGHEYWLAMNLAGAYASANHREIHKKIARELGMVPIARIENHHNFAWKEKLPDGRMAVVHRKGATPAGAGTIGIIPGSMTHSGFVVRGRGNPASLNSASHGAGRLMSRSQAQKSFGWNQLEQVLKQHGVELIGGDTDEAPMAYKDIERVMAHQHELVDVLAVFRPRMVRMADADRRRRYSGPAD